MLDWSAAWRADSHFTSVCIPVVYLQSDVESRLVWGCSQFLRRTAHNVSSLIVDKPINFNRSPREHIWQLLLDWLSLTSLLFLLKRLGMMWNQHHVCRVLKLGMWEIVFTIFRLMSWAAGLGLVILSQSKSFGRWALAWQVSMMIKARLGCRSVMGSCCMCALVGFPWGGVGLYILLRR